MLAAKWRPFCLGLNEFNMYFVAKHFGYLFLLIGRHFFICLVFILPSNVLARVIMNVVPNNLDNKKWVMVFIILFKRYRFPTHDLLPCPVLGWFPVGPWIVVAPSFGPLRFFVVVRIQWGFECMDFKFTWLMQIQRLDKRHTNIVRENYRRCIHFNQPGCFHGLAYKYLCTYKNKYRPHIVRYRKHNKAVGDAARCPFDSQTVEHGICMGLCDFNVQNMLFIHIQMGGSPTWWRHNMSRLSVSLAICEGNLSGFALTMKVW